MTTSFSRNRLSRRDALIRMGLGVVGASLGAAASPPAAAAPAGPAEAPEPTEALKPRAPTVRRPTAAPARQARAVAQPGGSLRAVLSSEPTSLSPLVLRTTFDRTATLPILDTF